MVRAAFVAIGVVIGVGGSVAAQTAVQSAERYLVIPFENPSKDARVLLARRGIGDAACRRSERARPSCVHARGASRGVRGSCRCLQASSLSHATVIRLGQVVGATHVVIGSFTLTGTQIVVKAQSIRLDSGRMENEVVESGSLESLFAIFERVSRRVAGANARSRDRPAGRTCRCSSSTSRA